MNSHSGRPTYRLYKDSRARILVNVGIVTHLLLQPLLQRNRSPPAAQLHPLACTPSTNRCSELPASPAAAATGIGATISAACEHLTTPTNEPFQNPDLPSEYNLTLAVFLRPPSTPFCCLLAVYGPSLIQDCCTICTAASLMT